MRPKKEETFILLILGCKQINRTLSSDRVFFLLYELNAVSPANQWSCRWFRPRVHILKQCLPRFFKWKDADEKRNLDVDLIEFHLSLVWSTIRSYIVILRLHESLQDVLLGYMNFGRLIVNLVEK